MDELEEEQCGLGGLPIFREVALYPLLFTRAWSEVDRRNPDVSVSTHPAPTVQPLPDQDQPHVSSDDWQRCFSAPSC